MLRDSMTAMKQFAEVVAVSSDIETSQVLEWLKKLVDENRATQANILKEMGNLRVDFTKHQGHVNEKFADIDSRLKFRHIIVGLLGAAIPAGIVIVFQLLK